jgi:DNA-binding NtrC family response regulator
MAQQDLKGQLVDIVGELVEQGVTLAQARREFEKQFIVASIRSNDGNLGRSARSMGVHRNTLRNKVSDLGIESQEYDRASCSATPGRTRRGIPSARPENLLLSGS